MTSSITKNQSEKKRREKERERKKEKSVKLSLSELLPYQKLMMLKLTLR